MVNAGDPPAIRLAVVAGGLGEWYTKHERAQEATPYAFVDVEDQPALLDLPAQSRAADWSATAAWLPGAPTIRISVVAPIALTLDLELDNPQLKGLVALIERDRLLHVCPTTPRLGINAQLARDRSFLVEVAPRPPTHD